jgi:IMP dehydrogenase
MELFFGWKEIPSRSRGLTYDDVLCVPNHSKIKSRFDPILESKLTRNRKIKIPIISSNMDTITEAKMAIAMQELGAFGIIHRFITIEQQKKEVCTLVEKNFKDISASIGTECSDKERAEELVKSGVNIITIDIAHGHSCSMLEMLKWLRKKFGDKIDIIAGNVATDMATYELIQEGADAIKVGIGAGSMCETRIVAGCGIPQLTAVAICAKVGHKFDVPIIADAGIKTSGDMVKAFAAGASSVMVGSMLSGTIETPGEIKNGKKVYRGMASREAQISWRGGIKSGLAPEGRSTEVPVKGHVKDVMLEIIGGIRSGMSYLNAHYFDEIRQKTKFIEVTPAGVAEAGAHGLR